MATKSKKLDAWRVGAVRELDVLWATFRNLSPPAGVKAEAFELLTAALIYLRNGLTSASDPWLHGTLVLRDKRSRRHGDLRSSERCPLFDSAPPHTQRFLTTMHVASSAFRLPTGLWLVRHSLPDTFGPFAGPEDWSRRQLRQSLERAASLRCAPALDVTTSVARIQECLAIVVAHRDEFAHGEVASGEGWWRTRSVVFPALPRCRLVEAQINLLRFGSRVLT